MLTGTELGAAIARAIERKGVTKKAFADAMGVKPASVQDWIKYGRIAKNRIADLVQYFSDVAGPDYWGLEYVSTAPSVGKIAGFVQLIGRGTRTPSDLDPKDQYMELSRYAHGKQGDSPFSNVVAMIARAAMEADALGVPTEKLLAIHKILVTVTDAQKAVSVANRRIDEVVADAELPSDKEVEAALADLGLTPDRGSAKDGRSSNRRHHRKSG
ncbi:hypothetical protein [Paraburkholderia largidicola]|uniref:Uncharacterized protein n=1 Tax=Paraburkholderia largidicola TaxID=3014751 RepID=A0A7I8BJU4_9BURK|nr:hypothetical protein [Paraburkholderia sp. PGU16]BCF88708.1 hypothetical protein PPGU16_17750 [Paraburkholderia sp. PGU16]